MKRIRVMHVVRTMATGGTEGGVRKLLSGLKTDEFEQSLCTLITDPMSNTPKSTRVICLGRAPNQAAFLVPQLTRVFARERPDVVHSRNWAAIEAVAAAKLARVPVVIHSEHGRDMETMGPQPWRRRAIRRLSFRWADSVFCVSRELRDYYCQELGLPSTANIDVIPNGVDTNLFRPNPEARRTVREMLAADSETLVIGTVSRLDPIKDQSTLIAAAATAYERGLDLRLVIVGDGVCRPALKEELATRSALRARTFMPGEVSNVSDWLNGFDVFVLPSLSEGMSNTLLEAMAVGVTPVATAVGGNLEVIEDGISGLLVPPRSPDEVCRCLERLVSVSLRRQLGGNARKRVLADFSLDSMLKKYALLYGGLLQPDRVGSAILSRA
ncbi:MAG TPA: glycosyltransferase [Terriglobales bacterium]|nr:glycosyltransferase [Terriglobales bacterium]